jgi:hypothetical protein
MRLRTEIHIEGLAASPVAQAVRSQHAGLESLIRQDQPGKKQIENGIIVKVEMFSWIDFLSSLSKKNSQEAPTIQQKVAKISGSRCRCESNGHK